MANSSGATPLSSQGEESARHRRLVAACHRSARAVRALPQALTGTPGAHATAPARDKPSTWSSTAILEEVPMAAGPT